MNLVHEIVTVFGSYRAENLGDEVFNIYTQPSYFPKLLTPIPCILIGGRGTGKTTALRSLSYDGSHQINLGRRHKKTVNYIGLYYKFEAGLVNAFTGAGKGEDFWTKAFSHFINLQFCSSLCEYALWAEREKNFAWRLDRALLNAFCIASDMPLVETVDQLYEQILFKLAGLEIEINSAADNYTPQYSAIGSLPRRLINIFRANDEVRDKIFYFLLDEYENLTVYQQRVLNTFVKQADSALSFKIGVKSLGVKTRDTLNRDEQLVDPADYVRIDVAEGLTEREYEKFAHDVVLSRFKALKKKGIEIPVDIRGAFEELTYEEEALRLGAGAIADAVANVLNTDGTTNGKHLALTAGELALIDFIAKGKKENYPNVYFEAIRNPRKWENLKNNHGYASLFRIRKGKVGIDKYYCGWKTLLLLSAHNIRYFLQLITTSLVEHLKKDLPLTQTVSAEIQTKVAIDVGQKNLMELEGLSSRGAQLMKLVLSLGQVFHEMAIRPVGHAPEVNQFEIEQNDGIDNAKHTEVQEILNAAVMHLALIRIKGTKLYGAGDTQDFDYMLHPLFSAFFVYSHRKKRKLTLKESDILDLIDSTPTAIVRLLEKQNRTVKIRLPEQLKLFGAFYEGSSR